MTWVTVDGLHIRVGSPEWIWYERNRLRILGRPAVPLTAMHERERVAHMLLWGHLHAERIGYTMQAERAHWLYDHNTHPGWKRDEYLPFSTDCSGFVTFAYCLAGRPDPNGYHYKALGYTGSLLANAKSVHYIADDARVAQVADLIVIGPGTGEHVVGVVHPGGDPIVVSHGDSSGPTLQHLSADPRTPKRVCTYHL